MGNFFEQMNEDKQKNLEAMEQKAKEYEQVAAEIAKLKATVQGLQDDIDGLKDSIGGLDKTLQTITPQDIQKFKDESLTIFKPLQDTAAAVNTKIKAAGYEAAQTLKTAGKTNTKDIIATATATALIFLGLSMLTFYLLGFNELKNNVSYLKNKSEVIHYNQTTGRTAGTFDPWHMSDFWKKYNEVGEQVRQQMIEAAKQQQQK